MAIAALPETGYVVTRSRPYHKTGGCDVIASLPEAEGTPPILDTLDSIL